MSGFGHYLHIPEGVDGRSDKGRLQRRVLWQVSERTGEGSGERAFELRRAGDQGLKDEHAYDGRLATIQWLTGALSVAARCMQSVQEQQAAKAKAVESKKGKQSAKALARQDAKRLTFDPKQIPKAVQTALDTEFSDWQENEKEVLVHEDKNLRQSLQAGYEAAAALGNTRVESGFFLGYRRIFSVCMELQQQSLNSSNSFEDFSLGEITQPSAASIDVQQVAATVLGSPAKDQDSVCVRDGAVRGNTCNSRGQST